MPLLQPQRIEIVLVKQIWSRLLVLGLDELPCDEVDALRTTGPAPYQSIPQ
jgi:hypothetical protein